MILFFTIAGWVFKISALLIAACALFRVQAKPLKVLPFLFLAASLVAASTYAMEAVMAVRSANPYERAAFGYRVFGPYWWAYWIMVLSTCVLPNLLWIPRLRKARAALVLIPLASLVLPWMEPAIVAGFYKKKADLPPDVAR